MARTPSKSMTLAWILQLVVAVILGQTLFFKFTGAEESKHIFQTLGAEPWGRYASGAAELLAVVLLLSGRKAFYGALLAAAVMVGAIGSHLFTDLGIEVLGDGGLLFGMACAALVCSLVIAKLRYGTG